MAQVYRGKLSEVLEDSPQVATDVAAFLEEGEVTTYGFTSLQGNATDKPDKEIKLDNVIRVSFPAEIPKELQERYKQSKADVDKWHSWVQGKTGALIAKKQKTKELPVDLENVDSKIKVDNYGARVFDTILRTNSPWLPVFYRDQKHLGITEKKFDLHSTILKEALKDIVSEPRLMSKVEGVFDIITKAVSFGIKKTDSSRAIWIMLEYYTYDAQVDEIKTVVRVISFDASSKMREFTSTKARFNEVSLDINYYQTDAKFVKSTWTIAEKRIDKDIEDAVNRAIGEELDVPVE